MTKPKTTRPLSDMEIETIRMVARGWTNEQIADHQGVKLSTVRARISTLYHLIGVAASAGDPGGTNGVSRARMTAWAYEQGLVVRAEPLTRTRALDEQAYAVCRGLVLKRPVPLLREQAIAVIRQADADLVADEASRAA